MAGRLGNYRTQTTTIILTYQLTIKIQIIMTTNTYNYADQLTELEEVFEQALKKWNERWGGASSVAVCRLRMKSCSPYCRGVDYNGGYYDTDALREFAKKLRNHGYFTYWGKPSHAYNSWQYLEVFVARQEGYYNITEITD